MQDDWTRNRGRMGVLRHHESRLVPSSSVIERLSVVTRCRIAIRGCI